MCRLLIARMEDPEKADLLAKLVKLHYRASSNDPLLAEVTGGDGRHCHGFGSVVLLDYGNGWILDYVRFDAADFYRDMEKACNVNLEALKHHSERLSSLISGARKAVVLLHSRRASKGMPRGLLNTHPFHVGIATSDYKELFLVHNGSVDSRELAKLLNLPSEKYTDSHLFSLWVAERIKSESDIIEALNEGRKFIKSAYIIGTLLIGARANLKVAYAALWKEDISGKRLQYIEPYMIDTEGLRVLVSSTIKLYADTEGFEVQFRPVKGVGYL